MKLMPLAFFSVVKKLWAEGELTNLSKKETDVATSRWYLAEDTVVIVWNVLGLEHDPWVDDWPAMPVDIYQLYL